MRAEDPPVAIELAGDVRSFFEGVLVEARRIQGVPATEAVQSYLLALLVGFMRPGHSLQEDKTPFTILFQQALEARPAERFERLRVLGDRVLYTTGFFRAHLEKRGAEIDYIEALGARAYDAASCMLRARVVGSDRAMGADVLGELAERFAELAALLAEASNMLAARSAQSPRALLRVYERWLRTGSAALASALGERGLVPQRNWGGLH